MPKTVPVQIHMTKPGSKLNYRVEYPNGNEKWVEERPGHKSDKWKIREKRKLLRNPAIKDFLIKMENVINAFRNDEATEEDIQKTVRDFETTEGQNKARMLVRRLLRSEKVKLEKSKKEDIDVDYHESVVSALDVAVEFVNRRRRDKPSGKKAGGRLARIAASLALGVISERMAVGIATLAYKGR